MNTNLATVVGLPTHTPYNRIMSFINEYESKNTRTSYTKYFKDMFEYMTGKSMEQVTYNDIKFIDKQRVRDYRIFLRDGKEYKATTINQRMFANKALWDDFKEDDIVKSNPFDLDPLKQEENNYGSLTLEEMENLYQYSLNQKHKPMTQKLYWEFLFVVTCRKNVAQELKWDQFKRELDIDKKQMVWVVSFPDKGKYIKKGITDEFYNTLKENYESEKETSGLVFCRIDNKTYDATLKGFCEEYGIDREERNIVQHSIKSAGLDHIQNLIGDINVTAQAAQHSNIQITYDRYLNKNKRYTEQPSFMLHKDFSIDRLKDLDKDVLLKLIENSGKETIAKLVMELDKSK